MLYFETASQYLDTKATLEAKLAAINEIQAALLVAATKSATQGHIDEYMLNDGQTIIKTKYRNTEQIMNSYDSMEVIKQRVLASLNGTRVVRLMDSKNFPPYGYGRNGR